MKRHILVTSIIAIGLAGLSSAAESLIQNGTFGNPLAPWKVISLKDAPATENSVAEGVLTIKATGASEKILNRQLSQDVAVTAGKSYSLSFDVKGTLEGEKEMMVVITPTPIKFAAFRKIPITAEWATHEVKITPKEMELAEGAKPMLKFLMGKLKGEISFRNVTLVASE